MECSLFGGFGSFVGSGRCHRGLAGKNHFGRGRVLWCVDVGYTDVLEYFFDAFFFLDHETSLLGIGLDVIITVVGITPIVVPVICHFKRRVDFGPGLGVLVHARGARDWD